MTIRRFAGFPDLIAQVPVPGALFGTLLREIDDLAELKLLLHIFRLLHEQRRSPRYVRRSELLADPGLLRALAAGRDTATTPPDVLLGEALSHALARGTLLAIPVRDGATEDACLVLNTRVNERLVRDLASGE